MNTIRFLAALATGLLEFQHSFQGQIPPGVTVDNRGFSRKAETLKSEIQEMGGRPSFCSCHER